MRLFGPGWPGQRICFFDVWKMAEPDGTLLWTSTTGLRCIVIPFFGQCQLRLLRNVDTVRTEVFTDEDRALSAAKRWRRVYVRRRRRSTAPRR